MNQSQWTLNCHFNKTFNKSCYVLDFKCTTCVYSSNLQVSYFQVVAAVPAMVRIEIEKTAHKKIVCCFMFPPDYPKKNILIELKSKSLSDKLLSGLTEVKIIIFFIIYLKSKKHFISINKNKQQLNRRNLLQFITLFLKFFIYSPTFNRKLVYRP